MKKYLYVIITVLFYSFSNLNILDAIESTSRENIQKTEAESCTISFDPNDGTTQYVDFYKITVPINEKVSNPPNVPQRDGYIFKGWAYGYDDEDNPVFWDFENFTVTENTTLWAEWEQGCVVLFDPNDGTTQYVDFYKITVPINEKVSNPPNVPQRDGYIFKGWAYAYDDEDNPVFWDFENFTVTENTTLWAEWEQGCVVLFDPNDGTTQYVDFYKITVPINEKVSNPPNVPQRDGYIFKGWAYGYDDEDNPVFWDFENFTVTENTTLWAEWEQGCIVIFDPTNGTKYVDFYKLTVPFGEKITKQPENPKRDGYIFTGWYYALDNKKNPIFWDFKNSTVTNNMTLWASWKIDDSINPTKPNNGNNAESTVTGDSTKNFMVFIGLIITSGLIIGWYYRKKRKIK